MLFEIPVTYGKHIHPDIDEEYQQLLDIYRPIDGIVKGKIYEDFRFLWNKGMGDYTAGQAMKLALENNGVSTHAPMNGAAEYEDIIAGQELMNG